MPEPYQPPPIPTNVSPEIRRYLEAELAKIARIINELIQYNEDNP